MESTKRKLFVISDILKETDENNPMTANQICQALEFHGIKAERKSVSRDIKTLIESGRDIVMCQDKKKGCFLASRQFEDWELKLLIDAISQAKFLPATTSKTLSHKLLSTTSKTSSKVLASVSPLKRRTKGSNKSVQIVIDTVLKAIAQQRAISFQYTSYGKDLKPYLRKEGKTYGVNPYSLVWRNDFYYLVCNTFDHDGLSYYRLDRMKSVKITNQPLLSAQKVLGSGEKEHINDFVNNSICQYGGPKVYITLRIREHFMIDHLCDEFGSDILLKEEEFSFTATVETSESNGLYYWLLQYGENVEILSPSHIRERYIQKLKTITSQYDQKEF